MNKDHVIEPRSPQGNHTPGPWHWEVHDFSMASVCGPRGEEDHVLSVSPCSNCQKGETEWKFGRCITPNEADARLIIAAPELLEALRWCVEHENECLGDFKGRLLLAKDILAKVAAKQ